MVYTGPLRVMLLIDSSASMRPIRGTTNWGVGLPTAGIALDAVPRNATVSVATFAKHLKLTTWQDWSEARDTLLALQDEVPNRTTALYGALNESVAAFGEPRLGDTIFLITDGLENSSKEMLSTVVANLVAHGIRVFVFLAAPPEHKELVESWALEDAEAVTGNTGGMLFRFPISKQWVASGEAAAMANRIQSAMAHSYLVEIKLANPLTKRAKLKLETSLDPKRYTVAFPRRLEPCAASPQP